MSSPGSGARPALLLAGLAIVGFAANSILCRLALRPGDIDPASFTLIRLGSGALALAAIARVRAAGRRGRIQGGSVRAALALFGYAACFSFAYVSLPAGTGALLLFGSVQATMLGGGLRAGERMPARSWLGLGLALLGLVALVLPGVSAPAPVPAALMLAAGVSWGLYSLLGRGRPGVPGANPLAATAGNFARSVPLALLLSLISVRAAHTNVRGALLATASGAIASGLGYTLWYAALPSLGALLASLLQLATPVAVAAAGVLLLGEPLLPRVLASGAVILGGVALAVLRAPPRSGARL